MNWMSAPVRNSSKEREEFAHAFQTEDLDELNRILGQQYHVVVGNPPVHHSEGCGR